MNRLQDNSLVTLPAASPGFETVYAPIPPSFAEPATDGGGAVLAELLYVFRKWWLTAGLAGLLLASGGVMLLMSFHSPSYRAEALLQIDARDPHLVYRQDRGYHDSFVATQVELIRSPLLMNKVVARSEILQLAAIQSLEDPAQGLAEDLKIQQVGQSELISVSIKSSDPVTAARIVNSVVDAFLEFNGDDNSERVERMIVLLGQERAKRKAEMEAMRDQLNKLAADDPSLLAIADNAGGGSSLQALQTELATAQVNSHVLNARLATAKERLSRGDFTISETSVSAEIDQRPSVVDARKRIAEKQAGLAKSRAIAADAVAGPILAAERELEINRQHLVTLRQQLREATSNKLRAEAEAEVADQVKQYESELQQVSFLESQLKRRISEQLNQAPDDVGQSDLDFRFLKSELARMELVYQQVSDRMNELSTEMNRPARATDLMRATPPLRPEPANRLPKVAAIGLMGVCFPFVLAFFSERLRRPIRNADQLSRDAGMHVIGELTRLSEEKLYARNLDPRRSHRQEHLFEESINAICTRLLLAGQSDTSQVLSVASAVSGEGKTRVASQLAASMARFKDTPTLIIDADVRSPSLHAIFDVANDRGLADVLEQRHTAAETIVRNWSPTLHILPAGRPTRNPHALFRPELLEILLRELRAEYQYIIIDTPPVLAASEALTIANLSDGVVMCAMQNFSRSPQFNAACKQLLDVGAKPIGVVFNGVSVSGYKSAYGCYRHVPRSLPPV